MSAIFGSLKKIALWRTALACLVVPPIVPLGLTLVAVLPQAIAQRHAGEGLLEALVAAAALLPIAYLAFFVLGLALLSFYLEQGLESVPWFFVGGALCSLSMYLLVLSFEWTRPHDLVSRMLAGGLLIAFLGGISGLVLRQIVVAPRSCS